jgi:hypothetical protein
VTDSEGEKMMGYNGGNCPRRTIKADGSETDGLISKEVNQYPKSGVKVCKRD